MIAISAMISLAPEAVNFCDTTGSDVRCRIDLTDRACVALNSRSARV